MTQETASLNIKVKSEGAARASSELDRLENSSAKAERRTGKFANAQRKANTASAQLNRTIVGLGGSLGALFAVSRVTKYADSYTLLQNRLKTVTSSQEELTETTNKLFELSRESRSGISATVELYTRLKRNTEDLNISEQQLLATTELISKSFQISGASVQEAAASTIQLSQAFAKGVLNGDEFRSVAEQAPEILKAITKETGYTIGELKDLGAQGKLTSDLIVNSLLGQAGEIRSTYAETSSTVEQAWQQVENAVIGAIGRIDDSIGASDGFSKFLDRITANLKIFSGTATELEVAEEQIEKIVEQLATLQTVNFGGIFDDQIEDLQARLIAGYEKLNDLRKEGSESESSEVTRKLTIEDFDASPSKKLDALREQLNQETQAIQQSLALRKQVLEGALTEEEAAIYDSYFTRGQVFTENLNAQVAEIEKSYDERIEKAKGHADIVAELEKQKNSELLKAQSDYQEGAKALYDEFQIEMEESSRGFWERLSEHIGDTADNFDSMWGNTFDRFSSGIAEATTTALFEQQNFGDAMKEITRSAIQSVIQGLIEIGIQKLTLFALEKTIATTSAATSAATASATGTAIATAYAPAAAMASLASYGANSIPAMGGIAATVGLSSSLALAGMAHDGIDEVPREGTWLLDKGERVVDSRTNKDLKDYLSNGSGQSERKIEISAPITLGGDVSDEKILRTIERNPKRIARIINRLNGVPA